jgi:hypothetical protein
MCLCACVHLYVDMHISSHAYHVPGWRQRRQEFLTQGMPPVKKILKDRHCYVRNSGTNTEELLERNVSFPGETTSLLDLRVLLVR